ncbi:protein CROWDED NUCLEI 2 [Ziziphus jujuba]|uniref:Protein CROWDED NUCLEI 2 n=1 Tax=Ziziphus jujuba TaxID=326968 RepID=A0ABM3ZXP8_ZIZJJ|nr:protein CROWDED NUCLEI 2 [Ziziphus jujuba]
MQMGNFGENMELLKLSKFKLQLRTLVAQVRQLRERDLSAAEQLHHSVQKQKQTEEEYGRKLQELQEELASSHEMRQKLERKVSHLENDNALLENKQKELKATIQNLLQSREYFVNAYEESTSDMKRSIETGNRKLSFLSEKIKSHLLLFDSIEKEALSIKQLVDNIQHLVSEKDEVVAGLKGKLDVVTEFEKIFIEKICDLEKKLELEEEETQRKNKVISELEAQLEGAKLSSICQTQIDELQKILSVKDEVIQNLISEKEALHSEVGSMGIILEKIQRIVTCMNEEDKGRFSLLLEHQKGRNTVVTKGDNRIRDAAQNSTEKFSSKAYGTGRTEFTVSEGNASSPLSRKSVGNHILENNNTDSYVSEATSSEPQSGAGAPSISMKDYKDKSSTTIHPLASECSTTQVEASKDPAFGGSSYQYGQP